MNMFLRSTKKRVNKNAHRKGVRLKMNLSLMMATIMMMTMLWIKFEWLKIWRDNNGRDANFSRLLKWSCRALIIHPLIELLNAQQRKTLTCLCGRRAVQTDSCLKHWTTFRGKCSWKEHGPWHLVKEVSKVKLLMPLVKIFQWRGNKQKMPSFDSQ